MDAGNVAAWLLLFITVVGVVGIINILILIGSLIRFITGSKKPILFPWSAPVIGNRRLRHPEYLEQDIKRWRNQTVAPIWSACPESTFKLEIGSYPGPLGFERRSIRRSFESGVSGIPDVTPSILKDLLICEPIDPLMSGVLTLHVPTITVSIPEAPKKPSIDGRLFDTAPLEEKIQMWESIKPSIEPSIEMLTGPTGQWYREKYSQEYLFFSGELKEHESLIKDLKDLLEIQKKYNGKFLLADRNTNESYEAATKKHKELSERYQRLLVSEKSKALAFVLTLKKQAKEIKEGYESGSYEKVENYFDIFLQRLPLPNFVPKKWEIHYDETSQILLVDYKLLTFSQVDFCKPVLLNSGMKLKPLNKGEKKALTTAFYPSIILRLAKEIINHDLSNFVQAICLNGWVEHRDSATGQEKQTYIASLFAKKEDLTTISLENVDPVKCFESLKGRMIRTETLDIAAVNPVIHFDKSDKRFVEGRDVLDAISEDQNLAAIDWEDFEHLVRELFSKLFSKPGVEVRVTQASRDKGVDAVVFDPTPITGGKFVIQAKRYVNLVDVSAVRDLYGTLLNEGASKGILVTTSNYGADSYEFAKNKPINLINGAELLGLLEAHGYKARIDLEEARRLAVGQPIKGRH
jgi:HJR/Mrr/RecB family endonuclease